MIYIYIHGKEWGKIDDRGWVYHEGSRLGRLELTGSTLFAGGSLRNYLGSVNSYGDIVSTNLNKIASIDHNDYIYSSDLSYIGSAKGFWDWYNSLTSTKETTVKNISSNDNDNNNGNGSSGCFTCLMVVLVFLICMPVLSAILDGEIKKQSEEGRRTYKLKAFDDEHDFDYEEALDSDYYKKAETKYFSFYCCPDLYEEVDDEYFYQTSIKLYQHPDNLNYGYDKVLFERSAGMYDDDYSYDEYLDNYAYNRGFFKDKYEIVSQTSSEDSETGYSTMIVKRREGERYTTEYHIAAYDEGIFTMEITYHDPKSDDEENWINYYISAMHNGCSFLGNGEFITYEEYMDEQ